MVKVKEAKKMCSILRVKNMFKAFANPVNVNMNKKKRLREHGKNESAFFVLYIYIQTLESAIKL